MFPLSPDGWADRIRVVSAKFSTVCDLVSCLAVNPVGKETARTPIQSP